MPDVVTPRRALVSVSNKAGLVPFAQALAGRGVALVSTGGTARDLRAAGLSVTEVAEVTGAPEMMEGRVKTLHPAIHGGLLALRDRHADDLEARGIEGIDLLAVNLYPFEEALARGAGADELVETIDVGGPRCSARRPRTTPGWPWPPTPRTTTPCSRTSTRMAARGSPRAGRWRPGPSRERRPTTRPSRAGWRRARPRGTGRSAGG